MSPPFPPTSHSLTCTQTSRGSGTSMEESPLSRSLNATSLKGPLARLQVEDLGDSDFSSIESPDDASSASMPLSPPTMMRPLGARSASPMRSRPSSPRPSMGSRDGRVSPGASRRRLSGSMVHNRQLNASPKRRDSGVNFDSESERACDSPDDYEIRQRRKSALSCGFLGASMPNLASSSNQRHLKLPSSSSMQNSAVLSRRKSMNISVPQSVSAMSPLRRESPRGSMDDLLGATRLARGSDSKIVDTDTASFPRNPTHFEMKELEWQTAKQLHSIEWQRGRTPTRRSSSVHTLGSETRARSLSPVSNVVFSDFCDEEPSFSDVFKERFEKVSRQLERKLVRYRAQLIEDQGENEKIENGMLWISCCNSFSIPGTHAD